MDNLTVFFVGSPGHSSPSQKFSLTACLITLVAVVLPVASACAATPSVVVPTVRPPHSLPTKAPMPAHPVCCQPLSASPTNNTNLSNGIMSFIYSSNTCRALAIATCSQPTIVPAFQLMAAITVNQVNFIQIQPGTVSIPLICNKKKKWEIGEPPLTVSTIQCILSTR